MVSFVFLQALMMTYALSLPVNTMGNITMIGAGYSGVVDQLKTSQVLNLIIWACEC